MPIAQSHLFSPQPTSRDGASEAKRTIVLGRVSRSVVRDSAVRESQLLASHRDVRSALADILVERYA